MFQDEVDDIRLMLERDLSWVVGGLSGRIESSFDDFMINGTSGGTASDAGFMVSNSCL